MLFGKQNREKKELKKKVRGLMNQYDNEKIDSATYIKEMLDLSESYRKKKRRK